VDNDPSVKESRAVAEIADHPVLSKAQFGHLVKMILDAQAGH
jgi:hypothetical protein